MGLSEKGQSELYDQIGDGYAKQRRPDPRIQDSLHGQLKGISILLNVGAGHGSYEPVNISVVAVEPSIKMISQRRNRFSAVQARAEALPFSDNSFEAATAILTIQHWYDGKKPLSTCTQIDSYLTIFHYSIGIRISNTRQINRLCVHTHER